MKSKEKAIANTYVVHTQGMSNEGMQFVVGEQFRVLEIAGDVVLIEKEAEHYEETLRIQREEGQYAQHKQTQSANIGAFQVEKQAEVGIAGANALGQMGANGAGDINLSGGEGTGFNMVATMASMAVGGAVGQNIAGSMNNMMSGINQMPQTSTTPPPVPVVTYNVAVNGQATGPYDINTLQQMIMAGQLSASSLIWRTGMSEWVRADSVEELNNLFNTYIPPIPQEE